MSKREKATLESTQEAFKFLNHEINPFAANQGD